MREEQIARHGYSGGRLDHNAGRGYARRINTELPDDTEGKAEKADAKGPPP
jgi:hypothetical protein